MIEWFALIWFCAAPVLIPSDQCVRWAVPINQMTLALQHDQLEVPPESLDRCQAYVEARRPVWSGEAAKHGLEAVFACVSAVRP